MIEISLGLFAVMAALAFMGSFWLGTNVGEMVYEVYRMYRSKNDAS